VNAVRDRAKVTVSEPVDGTPRRRGKDKGPRRRLDKHVRVDKRVVAEAKRAVRKGITYIDWSTATTDVVFIRNVRPS
jgi:hypothetical protein